MFGSNRIVRIILILTMIFAGVSLVGLIVSSFDTETGIVVNQFVAVLILLGILIAAAFIAALGLRMLQNRGARQRDERDEQDEQDED